MRAKRITQFFSASCPECKHSALIARAARLTRANGTQYTAAEQADYIARHS